MRKFYTKNLFIILVLALVLITSSCRPRPGVIKMMRETPSNPWLVAPPIGKSLVIFYRPEDKAFKSSVGILNVTGGNVELVGILASGTKVSYIIDPGNYLFMSAGFGTFTHFMSADLQANNNYYVLLEHWANGWGGGGFNFKPVRQTDQLSEIVNKTIKTTRLVEKTDQSEEWLNSHMPNLLERLAKYDQFKLKKLIIHLQDSDGSQEK